MNDLLSHAAAFAGGAVLGAGTLGLLHGSVRRLVDGRAPAWLHPAGSLVRTLGTVAGFAWLAGGDASRLVACLAGWWLARQLVLAGISIGEGGRRCT